MSEQHYLAVIRMYAIVPGEPTEIGARLRPADAVAAFNAGGVASHVTDAVGEALDNAGAPCIAVGAEVESLRRMGGSWEALPLWDYAVGDVRGGTAAS